MPGSPQSEHQPSGDWWLKQEKGNQKAAARFICHLRGGKVNTHTPVVSVKTPEMAPVFSCNGHIPVAV